MKGVKPGALRASLVSLFLLVIVSVSFAQSVTVTPTSLAFGNQVLSTRSAAKNVTLKNGLSTRLTITSITYNLSDYSTTGGNCPLTPKTLAAGASCTISVSFTPKAIGSRAATLSVNDNASNSPQTVALTGTGVLAVSVTPTTLSFGNQALGTTSAAMIATLKNNQSSALTITSVTSSIVDFTLSGNTCPITPKQLGAGASCTMSVVFKPTLVGTRTGTLSITDNAANSPQKVTLSGTGVAANLVSISVAPNPASLAVGKTQQFTATGTFTDGSTQDLTSSASWASSVPAIASVSTKGLASGLRQGSTSISATSGAVTGSSLLSVTPAVLTSLAVTPQNVSLPLGSTQQYTATGTYSDGSSQDLTSSVSWSSSLGAVASITTGGLASGVGLGSATITATSNGLSASSTLTIVQPSLLSIAISPPNPSFALGTTKQLKATGTYSDGSTLDLTSVVSWSSANTAVMTVDAQGLASSTGVGSSVLTAKSGSVSGTTTGSVTPAVMVSIAVTPAIPSIPLGTNQQFTATATFTDSTVQDVTKAVQWNSDNAAVSTISNIAGNEGLSSSVGTGTATITASSAGITGSTLLTVTAASLVSIAVTPASPALALGTKQQFTATGTFTDNSTKDLTASSTWASDAPAVVTVNNAGLGSSIAIGNANISATLGAITGSASVTVTPAALVSVAVTPPAPSTPLGTQQQFTAVGTFTDGSNLDVTQSGHWSSSDATVGTISNSPGTEGLASTLSSGQTVITFASAGISGIATLTVTPAQLVSLTVNPLSPTIPLGTAQQFTATGTYTDGSQQDVTSTVNWTSSVATVAVMSTDPNTAGLATSSGTGVTTINASSGAVNASTTLTVGPPGLVSIDIVPAGASIYVGTTQQFHAMGTYTDGSTQDVTASVAWSSSMPAVGSIDASGLASGLSSGATTISATSGPVSSGVVLNVAAAVGVSLAITPVNPTVSYGSQVQFQALLTLSNGTVQDVTSQVVWSSGAPNVASISNTGLANGLAGGSSLITAVSGSLNATSLLTVTPAPLVSIAISPGNPTIQLSDTLQFTATGTFADSSTQDLTSSATWSSSNSSIISVNVSGLANGTGFGSASVQATIGSVTGSASATVPTVPTVPASLFDMTINKTTTPWPADSFFGERLLGTSTKWGDIETADGTYNFRNLDARISAAQSHNVDLVFTFVGVPAWASSNPNDTTCAYWAGACDAPNDLNADGTGTNKHWKDFVTMIAAHTGSAIKYWELWNEPNISGQANKNWTSAQWVRMGNDARSIILASNPGASFLSPGVAITSNTNWLKNFLAAGGTSYADIIAYHGYAVPPEVEISEIASIQAAMLTGGASSKPLWDTEGSWGPPSNVPDLNLQAGYVARMYLLHAANGVARFYWYGWEFGGALWQPDTLIGCTSPSNGGYLCPSGLAYQQTYNWIVGAVLRGCSATGTTWTCTVARPTGYLAQIVWDTSQTCNGGCTTVPYVPQPQFIKYRDLNGNTFGVSGSSVPIGAQPIILENQ